MVDRREDGLPRGIRVYFDVVPDRRRRKEAVDSLGGEPALLDDFIEEPARVVEQFLGSWPDGWVLENRGIVPLQFPRMEKRRPINVRNQLDQRLRLNGLHSQCPGYRDIDLIPIGNEPMSTGLGNREEWLGPTILMRLPHPFVVVPHLFYEPFPLRMTHQASHNTHRA